MTVALFAGSAIGYPDDDARVWPTARPRAEKNCHIRRPNQPVTVQVCE